MSFMFVFGPARTGTSALTWELNSTGDIFIIPELGAASIDPDNGQTTAGQHFGRAYIERAVRSNMGRMLENLRLFTPTARTVTPAGVIKFLEKFRTPDDLLEYLETLYKVTGTKIVLFADTRALDVDFQYQKRHHYADFHIATWRDPDQTAGSSTRMFSSIPRQQIFSNMVAAYAETLRMISEFPNRIIMPNGSATAQALSSIRQRVGLPGQKALNVIDVENIQTHKQSVEFETMQQEKMLARLRAVNHNFLSSLSWQEGVADIDNNIARELRDFLTNSR